MADLSAGGGAGEGGPAGVGKKIENLDRTPGRGDFFRHPVPVDRLFRKNAGMLKAHGFQTEGQAAVVDFPNGRNIGDFFPVPAARGGAEVSGVSSPPHGMFLWSAPEDLRVGTD